MIHQKIFDALRSVFNASIFKSNEYFLNYELLNELITQNIVIFCPVSTPPSKGGKKPGKQEAPKTTRKTCHRRRVTCLTTDDNG